jgi:hypothetical protein
MRLLLPCADARACVCGAGRFCALFAFSWRTRGGGCGSGAHPLSVRAHTRTTRTSTRTHLSRLRALTQLFPLSLFLFRRVYLGAAASRGAVFRVISISACAASERRGVVRRARCGAARVR